MHVRLLALFLAVGLAAAEGRPAVAQSPTTDEAKVAWPDEHRTARPWTRWWWHGAAVDEPNLSRLLREYQQAGLGGVEITCIYGVKGNEDRHLVYLSDEWVAAVQYVLRVADELDMGVDLPAGSGWRMGGPSVTRELANHRVVIDTQQLRGGQTFTAQFDRTTPQIIRAVNAEGDQRDLTDLIADGRIRWQVPEGQWTVYTLGYTWAGDRVKRPGPGGAGLNINPFSKQSVSSFLQHFGATLEKLPGIRAQFHDSFEYEGNWQPEFLDEFAARRGYRLEDHLPLLAGDGPQELVERLKCDYRETLADLVRDDLVGTWVAWAHEHGQLARNQSHGSPANWLDLYAACDIPETETFGRLHGDDADLLILKFASSAAHLVGRPLVSSETATWLDEHFNVTLAQVRQIADRQILAGVNHVFYHGTAYSPEEASWPGWLFYASTQLNPQNPIWRDFPALNRYLTRCQSVLQASRPDNDVLLYWPLHDAWHTPRGLRMNVRVHNGRDWFYGWPVGEAAEWLQDAGYAFDYVSDRGLASCQPGGEASIEAPGGRYQVVVVPKARHLPLATLEKLNELAAAGAKVVFWGDLPGSEPGMAGADPSAAWNAAIEQARGHVESDAVLQADDLATALRRLDVRREEGLQEHGLSFFRQRWDGHAIYFVKNETDQPVDASIPLAAGEPHYVLMDPTSGRIGQAECRATEDAPPAVRLQLAAGESVLVRGVAEDNAAAAWPYVEAVGQPVAIGDRWRVEFIEGGPTLPEAYETAEPQPWTEASDADAKRFAGTVRYSTRFDRPEAAADRWRLDLGQVLGSARVRLNGVDLGTRIAPPFLVDFNELKPSGNQLEIEVTGVAANRIRDLDRRGVQWRIFEDINLVNIDYGAFDASEWPVRPLGLSEPVTLAPLQSSAGQSTE